MYAGVILYEKFQPLMNLGVPRVCGGDPLLFDRSSPLRSVFPVYAGVILIQSKVMTVFYGVPRVCGGDPEKGLKAAEVNGCSPCMRG